MLISLHKNATTTPATRLAIQQAHGTEAELAQRFGVGKVTIRKWRKRNTVEDGSHTPHRLQTTLNAGQEEIVVYLRTHLRLSLDDLLAVVREFIEPAMSRSALDRLLRRRGINRLPEPEVEKTQVKPFKAYEPGYVHMDVKYLPQMEDESERRYVFVAIDRATRWVFIAVKSKKTAAAARSYLNALHKAAPFKIKTLLTDNGREFTDRAFGRREKDASGEHEFDALCQALGIEHRLTKPKHPQTNGMVERFNGRLAQVLKSHRFNSAHDLETTLHRFVWLYNEHLPQRALDLNTPIQALKKWQATHPNLFVKRVVNHPGPDNYRQATDTGAEVRKGDTLWKLSGYDKEVFGRLKSGMGLDNPNNIQPGQVMRRDEGLSTNEAIASANDFFKTDGLAKAAAMSSPVADARTLVMSEAANCSNSTVCQAIADRNEHYANVLAKESQRALSSGDKRLGDLLQSEANNFYYAGQRASLNALHMNAASQAATPITYSNPFGEGWNTGEYSAGLPYRRGIDSPDYLSLQGSFYVGSGGIAVNLHSGEVFGQWGLGRPYPAPSLEPGFSAMIGFINNVDDAASTSEFLQGAGWQASVVMPVTPLIGVGGGVNHSYGGATSIELGIGTPGAGAAPFGYGFELEKKDGKP